MPRPFRQARNGEKSHTFECIHVACEGNGLFTVADGALQNMLEQGNRRVNCDSCKLWMYNTERQDSVSGVCENYKNSVSVQPSDYIGYYKYKDKPTFSIFCNTCDRNRQQARQATHDRQITLSYLGNREDIRKFGMEHENEVVRDEAKRLQLQSKFAKCHPIAFDDLVDISDGFYHNYHNHPVNDGNDNKESAYTNIRHHLDGSNGKIASLPGFENTVSIIKYAHGVAQINDPSRIINSHEDKD